MPIPTQTQEMLLPPQNRIAPEKRDAFIAFINARLTKVIFFLSVLWVFACVAVTRGFGQTLPAEARGIVLYQDLQTRYVEAFAYLACASVNVYITGYTLPGGIYRQTHNAGILKAVEFPMPGSPTPSAAQMQRALDELDLMAKQYPQHATLLGNASARLRVALVAAQPASKPPQPPTRTATATTPVQRLLAPSEPASAATTNLTLKNGVRLREVKILRANNDRFTVRHQTGVVDVLFSDLPGDPGTLPPEVRTLLNAYQDRLAAAAAEKERVAAEAEKQRASVETEKQRVAAEVEKQRDPVKTEKQEVAAIAAPQVTPPTNAPVLITDGSALPSANPVSPSSEPAWRSSVLPGLMVKGLLIGMDGAEAAKTLLEQGQGKLGLIATTVPKENGYEICMVSNGHRVSQGIGHLRFDPKDGTLTRFVFYGKLSDLLFNTADQGAEEFAQTFINAYGVRTIKPTAVGGH